MELKTLKFHGPFSLKSFYFFFFCIKINIKITPDIKPPIWAAYATPPPVFEEKDELKN